MNLRRASVAIRNHIGVIHIFDIQPNLNSIININKLYEVMNILQLIALIAVSASGGSPGETARFDPPTRSS